MDPKMESGVSDKPTWSLDTILVTILDGTRGISRVQ